MRDGSMRTPGQFQAAIEEAVKQAIWDGLTRQDVVEILRAQAVVQAHK